MILGVLQARMSSTRLPGKVMRDLVGAPMIDRQIERLRRAETLDRLVAAISDETSDDVLAEHLEGIGVAVHRGPLSDVLARFAGALDAFPADHVVRLTGDCPLTDWRLLDRVVRLHREGGFDYTANDLERTYPKGLDVEICTAEALRAAAREANTPFDREHVTPFIYGQPGRFRLGSLTGSPDLSALRWTVDTPEDFAFVEGVYRRLYPGNPAFTSEDVLALPPIHHPVGGPPSPQGGRRKT